MRQAAHNTLLLFTSFSTLLCCALPALFVALGAGAVLAGIVTQVPQLVFLSAHKVWLFSIAGALLALSGILRYRTRNAPCPVDPALAKACARLRRSSFIVYVTSITIFAIGLFFAYVAPLFL